VARNNRKRFSVPKSTRAFEKPTTVNLEKRMLPFFSFVRLELIFH
jgi:hypothetical protein